MEVECNYHLEWSKQNYVEKIYSHIEPLSRMISALSRMISEHLFVLVQ